MRRIGINHATLSKWADAGDQTNYGTRNKALWTLYIPSYECELINTRLKVAERIGSRYAQNNAHPEGELIDRARKQKILSIEKLEGKHDTYCFTEPEKHMGVFGNALTYQCLVETYPGKHETLEEWQETLKYAYLYAKSVTLVPTHNKLTNAVLLRNRRIGCSMSGIVQAFKKFGRRAMMESASKGYDKIQSYDKIYSEWLCVPRSIKTTSIKPSGTVSLLAGVTPGIHYPISQYYIRNVRFQEGSSLLVELRAAGYKVEKDKYSLNTWVVSFPVQEEFFDRSINDVSMWEQLENAAQIQEHWADNQVSVTITFTADEAKDIKNALELYESRLKGVSFLPKKDHGYEQAPYIPITKEEYETLSKEVKPIASLQNVAHEQTDKFCDGDKCLL
jgi:adenosylcobalamin-dependent ribonucleoside-triphosphate reductase